eukprot:583910-Rhodomonas_salina.1
MKDRTQQACAGYAPTSDARNRIFQYKWYQECGGALECRCVLAESSCLAGASGSPLQCWMCPRLYSANSTTRNRVPGPSCAEWRFLRLVFDFGRARHHPSMCVQVSRQACTFKGIAPRASTLDRAGGSRSCGIESRAHLKAKSVSRRVRVSTCKCSGGPLHHSFTGRLILGLIPAGSRVGSAGSVFKAGRPPRQARGSESVRVTRRPRGVHAADHVGITWGSHDLDVGALLADVREVVGHDPEHVVRVAPCTCGGARNRTQTPRNQTQHPEIKCKKPHNWYQLYLKKRFLVLDFRGCMKRCMDSVSLQ